MYSGHRGHGPPAYPPQVNTDTAPSKRGRATSSNTNDTVEIAKQQTSPRSNAAGLQTIPSSYAESSNLQENDIPIPASFGDVPHMKEFSGTGTSAPIILRSPLSVVEHQIRVAPSHHTDNDHIFNRSLGDGQLSGPPTNASHVSISYGAPHAPDNYSWNHDVLPQGDGQDGSHVARYSSASQAPDNHSSNSNLLPQGSQPSRDEYEVYQSKHLGFRVESLREDPDGRYPETPHPTRSISTTFDESSILRAAAGLSDAALFVTPHTTLPSATGDTGVRTSHRVHPYARDRRATEDAVEYDPHLGFPRRDRSHRDIQDYARRDHRQGSDSHQKRGANTRRVAPGFRRIPTWNTPDVTPDVARAHRSLANGPPSQRGASYPGATAIDCNGRFDPAVPGGSSAALPDSLKRPLNLSGHNAEKLEAVLTMRRYKDAVTAFLHDLAGITGRRLQSPPRSSRSISGVQTHGTGSECYDGWTPGPNVPVNPSVSGSHLSVNAFEVNQTVAPQCDGPPDFVPDNGAMPSGSGTYGRPGNYVQQPDASGPTYAPVPLPGRGFTFAPQWDGPSNYVPDNMAMPSGMPSGSGTYGRPENYVQQPEEYEPSYAPVPQPDPTTSHATPEDMVAPYEAEIAQMGQQGGGRGWQNFASTASTSANAYTGITLAEYPTDNLGPSSYYTDQSSASGYPRYTVPEEPGEWSDEGN